MGRSLAYGGLAPAAEFASAKQHVVERGWERGRGRVRRSVRRKKHAFRADDVQVVEPPLLRRAVGASALGNCMEWFDFGVYSHLAATIGSTARSPWSVRGGSGRN
ncbi:hypothetical protein FBY22_2933 [Streptomyces sp. SLBN-31]|nr:hypothetical protein FBY22_2933 [Streptomyces sp. SLBN-31]